MQREDQEIRTKLRERMKELMDSVLNFTPDPEDEGFEEGDSLAAQWVKENEIMIEVTRRIGEATPQKFEVTTTLGYQTISVVFEIGGAFHVKGSQGGIYERMVPAESDTKLEIFNHLCETCE